MTASPLNGQAEDNAADTGASGSGAQPQRRPLVRRRTLRVPSPISKSDSFSYDRLADIHPTSYEIDNVTASAS